MINQIYIAELHHATKRAAEIQQTDDLVARSYRAGCDLKRLCVGSNSVLSESQQLRSGIRNQRLESQVARLFMRKERDRIKHQSDLAAFPFGPTSDKAEIAKNAHYLPNRSTRLAGYSEQMCAASTVLVLRTKRIIEKTSKSTRTLEGQHCVTNADIATNRQPTQCPASLK